MASLLPFERMQRQILEKKKAKTSPKYGIVPSERATSQLLQYGIINIDKPKGPTSHQVSAYAQQILGITKAGHSGTLDPRVTGVLPIALGAATKVVQALLPAGKEYVCIMHLHKDVSEQSVREACALFVGRIRQMPPLKSAVKRQFRYRRVYYLDILEIKGRDVLFRVGCQAGTYIRVLCHDIGQKLGTGAHMAELRRTKAGPFDEATVHTLQDLQDAFWYFKNDHDESMLRKIIMPMEKAVDHLPKLWVLDSSVDSICHGASVKVPGVAKVETDIQIGELVAIMTLKGELVAFGQARMIPYDIIKAERGIAVSIDRVMMEPGTYPKLDRGQQPQQQDAEVSP
ncbi:RNA-guided pseudouridylation complex pseudouridine synthase subunit Cbf5 [Candidatus Woesearchaeota archaeon]|nr:RNA-guided pseudouridylation complex pseudouridine synthase subunit Cbf5 [Candidatus Woesearchaeota archaeon]